jgi:cytidyltransferase-like protein
MKVVVISGGFDPIHSGHISYINAASKLGDKLIVLLNSDKWLQNKKDREFMSFSERKIILESIKNIFKVLEFEDDELGSCINGLEKVKKMFPGAEIIFCNGGDRNKENIPEMVVKDIRFSFGIGGADKKNSSSWILKNWQYPSENRVWGSFYNLFTDAGVKVKELIVNPNSGMSFQRHFKRNEIWLVSEGKCIVNIARENPEDVEQIKLMKFNQLFIEVGCWHQITNPYNKTCKIIEIQFGKETDEEDIERLSYYEDKSV